MYDTKEEQELIELLKKGALIVDVRSPMEFREGTAKGAINIPLEDFEEHLETLKNEKGVILFCRSGARSGYLQSILQSWGVENVYNGGSWQYVNFLIQDRESVTN